VKDTIQSAKVLLTQLEVPVPAVPLSEAILQLVDELSSPGFS
jgi:hypothetical protein